MSIGPVEPVRRAWRQMLYLPDDARINDLDWDFESEKFVFTNTTDEGIELWLVSDLDGEVLEPRRLLGPVLNAAYGAPCDWLPGDAGLVCKVVDADRGLPPSTSSFRLGLRLMKTWDEKRRHGPIRTCCRARTMKRCLRTTSRPSWYTWVWMVLSDH